MKSITIGDAIIGVENTDRYTNDDRAIFKWTIGLGDEMFSEADLRSGCGGSPSELRMLETLLSFLGAAGESYRYNGMEGESSSLFPEPVTQWAAENADAISMEQCYLEEAIERSAKARNTLYNWHGGQDSQFYALASSGIVDNFFDLMKEFAGCIPQDDERDELEELGEFLGPNGGLGWSLELDTFVAPWHDE